MIRVFFTTIQNEGTGSNAGASKKRVRLLHEAAWSLLAGSLHSLNPSVFPSADVGSLPAVEKGSFGKPSFTDPSLPSFSLSHSGSVAVCAISEEGPVGVDVQEIRGMRGRMDIDGIAERFFHPAERELLDHAKDITERRRLFYTVFSCKEAYVKMTGSGISEDFRGFCTIFDGEGRPSYILDDKTDRITGYTVLNDFPIKDYVLVTCVNRELSREVLPQPYYRVLPHPQ